MIVDTIAAGPRHMLGGSLSYSAATYSVSTWDIVERLLSFDGEPAAFLTLLLDTQCRLADVSGGCFIKNGRIVSAYPARGDQHAPWLQMATEMSPRVAAQGKPFVIPVPPKSGLYAAEPEEDLILLPMRSAGNVRGIAGFVSRRPRRMSMDDVLQRLELSLMLLSLYEMRLTLEQRGSDLQRLRRANEVMLAVTREERLHAAAIAIVNHVATLWKADSVALGLVRHEQLRVVAMSHTEKIAREMERVQLTEAAMEECWDQDVEVIWPAEPQSTTISRAVGELSSRFGPAAIVSLPLRHRGTVLGVLTAEFSREDAMELADVESLRLACELSTPRLAELWERDRWFGARWEAATRRQLAKLLSPTHTWWKAAAVAASIALGVLVFGHGTYRVKSSFIVQAEQRHVITAPFDGFLWRVHVKPGDVIEAGKTVLAELDASQYRLELAEAKAEELSQRKQADIARRQDKIAEAQVYEADADKARARAELLAWKVQQAKITSPISGVLLSGDLQRQIGAPVQGGQTLFETGPLSSLRARIAVDENDVADIRIGQTGEVAAVSHPDHRVRFTVERIDPVAEVINGENVFAVYGRLDELPTWLRPGMEGVSKIDVDRRTWLSIWTREFVNWVRMKLWW